MKVYEGAKLLDAFFEGKSWRACIQLDDLKMHDTELCTLAHLFGSFEEGIEILHLTREQAVACGFDLARTTINFPQSWEDLRSLWTEEIKNG